MNPKEIAAQIAKNADNLRDLYTKAIAKSGITFKTPSIEEQVDSMAQAFKSIPKEIGAKIESPNAEIDPSDLPTELAAANIALQAVTNGYGDKSATFKNRLIDYLEKNFTNLGNEAVQRIATVANPDKTTGRKKREI